MGRSLEDLLLFHHRLGLRGSGRFSGAGGLLRGARGSLGDTRGLRDAECLRRRGGASRLFRGNTRVLGASRLQRPPLVLDLSLGRAPPLFFLAHQGEAFILIATLLVTALFFFTPLRRAPLLFLAPFRGTPLLFVAPLLLEACGVGRAGFIRGFASFFGGARRGDGSLGLGGRALRIGRAIGAGGACRFLRRAHRLLGRACSVRGALPFCGSFDVGSARGFLSGAHRFLGRASRFGRALGLGGAVRVGPLLRETLRLSDLARFVGGAGGLFGRPLRLFGGARRVGCAFRFRDALRLERAARFFLGGARLVLSNARLLLRGLRLLRRGVRLARRVRNGPGLTADVLEQLGEDTS